MRPLVVFLHMPGTNRDHDVVAAVERAVSRSLAGVWGGFMQQIRRSKGQN